MTTLKIENGFLTEIKEKEIKENDYILSYGELKIIDKDKRTIRPYLEDMLRQMNIETWQIKMLKLLIILMLVYFIVLFYLIWNTFSTGSKINTFGNNIQNINQNIENLKNTSLKTDNSLFMREVQEITKENNKEDNTNIQNNNSDILRGGFINNNK